MAIAHSSLLHQQPCSINHCGRQLTLDGVDGFMPATEVCSVADGRDFGGALPVADGADLSECQDSLGSTFPRPYVTCSCGQWASEHGQAAENATNKDTEGIQGCLSHLELFLTS